MENWVKDKNVLITGGTSGLGRSIAREFLAKGAKVIAVGRKEEGMPQHQNCRYLFCDFSKLRELTKPVDLIQKEDIKIDILLCNAGILSAFDYRTTEDGLEWSFQVNFLSHVLLTKLLFRNARKKPRLVINTSSPIYSRGSLDIDKICDKQSYNSFRAYANTKLYMALFSEKLAGEGLQSFSFNPGTFSSGIYRHQKLWFHFVYKIGAPFMTSSDRVASRMFRIILSKQWENGKMMSKQLKAKDLKYYDPEEKARFWSWVDGLIDAHTV